MHIRTRNSTYRVEELADPRRFKLTKVGGNDHPYVRDGDYFVGDALSARIGEPIVLEGVTEHVHVDGRACHNCRERLFSTSPIVKIEP